MARLDAEHARIFRITHIDNMPFILEHGLHCQSADDQDPDFIGIGMENLIEKRQHKIVSLAPGGVLSDYVPFYFTPYSIMMYNIHTGFNNVIKRPNRDIIVLVSSIHRLVELEVPFVFTDGHAYMQESEYYDSVDDLDKIDWKLLQSRNFTNDPEDPGKKVRYQAEALVHRQMPFEALMGLVCYDKESKERISEMVDEQGLSLDVKRLTNWYF